MSYFNYYLWEFSFANPQVAAATIVSALVCRLAAKKLQDFQQSSEIGMWASYFHTVAGNFDIHYRSASAAITSSFAQLESESVERAIGDLVNAIGKESAGTLLK